MPCSKGFARPTGRLFGESTDAAVHLRAPSWDADRDDLADELGVELDHEVPCVPRKAAVQALALVELKPVTEGTVDATISLGDFSDVFFESARSLAVDWRDSLVEALNFAVPQVARYGAALAVTSTRESPPIDVTFEGEPVRLLEEPSEEPIRQALWELNALLEGTAEYRLLRGSDDSDTLVFFVASPREWERLEARFPRLAERLFVTVS